MGKPLKKIVINLLVAFLLLLQSGPALAMEFEISGNGSGSDSQVTVNQQSQTTVTQSNQADITNNVTSSANTGDNPASGNTGGDTVITTGDVDSSVQVQNSANTSMVDVGCCPEDTQVTIFGNGGNSQNNVNLTLASNTNIVVNQTANIASNVNGSANTGGNSANDNSGTGVTIQTGNIKVAGGIKNGPTNVSSVKATRGVGGASVLVAENGSNSQNSVNLNLQSDTNVFGNFEANFENFSFWDLNTGENNVNGNTGGRVNIKTGDIDFSFFIDNSANFSSVDIDCCVFDPEEGEEPEDPKEPEDGEEPQNGGQMPPSGGKKEEQGKPLPSGAEAGAGGPGILGLADTSSGSFQRLLLIFGLLMLVFGSKIVSDEVHPAIFKRKTR